MTATTTPDTAPRAPLSDIQRIQARMRECPMRRHATCGDLDTRLGFEQAITMDECDACFAKGGPKAEQHHIDWAGRIVANCKSGIDKLPTVIALTVLGKHVTDPMERQVLAIRVAPRLGQKKTLAYAVRVGDAGLTAVLTKLFDGMSAEAEAVAMAPGDRWAEVQSGWESIEKEVSAGGFEPETHTLFQKIKFFVKAIAGGKSVSWEDLNTRHISCHGTDLDGKTIKAPCPSRRQEKGVMFCGHCGCGLTRAARLDNKLHHKNLVCPRLMPGFSNASITVGGKTIAIPVAAAVPAAEASVAPAAGPAAT